MTTEGFGKRSLLYGAELIFVENYLGGAGRGGPHTASRPETPRSAPRPHEPRRDATTRTLGAQAQHADLAPGPAATWPARPGDGICASKNDAGLPGSGGRGTPNKYARGSSTSHRDPPTEAHSDADDARNSQGSVSTGRDNLVVSFSETTSGELATTAVGDNRMWRVSVALCFQCEGASAMGY